MFRSDSKILIVEDMLTMRKLLSKSLNSIGLKNVREASDGEEAWAEIQRAIDLSEPFELIISDWNMPQISGIDLLKKVRSSEATQSTPFVLLTAEFDREEVVEAIKAGVNGYITKPFSLATLSQKLESIWANLTHQRNSDAA